MNTFIACSHIIVFGFLIFCVVRNMYIFLNIYLDHYCTVIILLLVFKHNLSVSVLVMASYAILEIVDGLCIHLLCVP